MSGQLLEPARRQLLGGAGSSAALALLTGGFMTVGFGWDLEKLWLGVLAGVIVWGATMFHVEVRHLVPRHDPMEPPATATIATRSRPGIVQGAIWVAWLVGGCAVIAWFADVTDAGAAIVSGQFAGYSAGRAVGWLRVARWERAHGRLLLVDEDSERDSPLLYATAPAALSAATSE